ncbi:MAG: TetR family transcriptional regulator [Alphaproteobacteria bacterium]|nr:TetR family transcriptional regulator [Alphaproteobacteria bacterium]
MKSRSRAKDRPRAKDGAEDERGRFRQRRRTRAQIVQATMDLLKTSSAPTINDIAEAADVSRRTVYMHFPTLEQLLIDAKLGLLSQSAVDDVIAAADHGGSAEARVTAMIGAISAMSRETLPLGRSLIRLTAEETRDVGVPRRGFRRIGWIEKALAPLRDQLPRAAFERLVSALAMVVGWEAVIVLEDVRGLAAREQQKTSLWAANALIHASLEENGTRRNNGRKAALRR